MRRTFTVLALLSACDGGGGGASAPRDAIAAPGPDQATAVPDAGRAPDAGPAMDASLRLACVCAEAPEDCEACFRLIGRCCDRTDGDETFGGRLDHIVSTCRLDPNCASCCDECAARTCEQVEAAGDCPE